MKTDEISHVVRDDCQIVMFYVGALSAAKPPHTNYLVKHCHSERSDPDSYRD